MGARGMPVLSGPRAAIALKLACWVGIRVRVDGMRRGHASHDLAVPVPAVRWPPVWGTNEHMYVS